MNLAPKNQRIQVNDDIHNGLERPIQNIGSVTPAPITFSTILPLNINPKTNTTMTITNHKDFVDAARDYEYEDDFRHSPVSENPPTTQQATERLFNIAKAFKNVFGVN